MLMGRVIRINFLPAAILGLALFFFGSARASAASQVLTISPAIQELKLEPGSVSKGTFNVINQGTEPFSFKVYATPYSVTGEDYTPDYNILPGAPTPITWFKFSVPASVVAPGQSVTESYTVTVPKNIQEGGYYSVGFAETLNPKVQQGVTINERVGTLFFIQVGNNVVKKGDLINWKSKFLQEPPLSSSFKLTNSGSIYYKAEYQYKVSDIFGSTKYYTVGQKVILPQATRKLTIPWRNSPSFGLFKVSGNVKFLDSDHKLSTKYVLIMSKAARLYTFIGFIAAVIIAIVLAVTRRRPGRKIKLSRRR